MKRSPDAGADHEESRIVSMDRLAHVVGQAQADVVGVRGGHGRCR